MIRNIFEFVQEQETSYQLPIEPVEGWSWNMKDHLRRSLLYKNSQFEIDNELRTKRPFKNIVLPLLNIQYRLEGFDVKDIDIYVTNPEHYYKSFLIKKYHDIWAVENNIDTLIDQIVESYVDYGGVLVKNGKDGIEVVDLQTIAFCDQTDLINGAFAIKHHYAPDQLREMKAWDERAIDMAITQAEYEKKQDKEGQESPTPTKYIEVYEIHGVFPDSLLVDEYTEEDTKNFSRQIHIISFYTDTNGRKQGIYFFKKKEPVSQFKFLKRDLGIFGRALGRGGVEELFEPQVWTNYSEQKITRLLDSASKVLYKTADPQFKARNSLDDLDDNEVLQIQNGADISQIDTTPRSIQLFYKSLETFKDNADRISAAGDALQGEQPKSGTPFALQELVTLENKGMHHHRRGQIAVFVDEIYRDWVLPKLAKEVQKERVYRTLLSADELQEIAETVTRNRVNRMIKDKILAGGIMDKETVAAFRGEFFESFVRGGRKRFLKIMEGEMKDEELGVMTNIAGKQKDLALLTEKVVGVVRQFMATPQMRQDPEMIKLVNTILESSGLSPIIFGANPYLPPTAQGQTQPLQQLGEAVTRQQPQNANA